MKIAVYCGASVGNKPSFATAAQELGQWIASRQNTLVYGGGKAGLMGVLADAVLENGGQVIGVIPTFLKDRELAHPGLTELHVVETMSERKRKMFELSQAFVALPGGPGTLEEITEMISWSRIGQNPNPCAFYDVNNFYRATRALYDNMVENEFLTQADREKIGFAQTTNELEAFIQAYEPPVIRQY
ncbi:TIGR00730 family Rossman fold protein [Enterococcus casseliflavus]|uniref:LOG family protein n=1 Tax=Enterococcus casseliflavus TaxID=37734 RepID=UPI00325A62DD